MPTSLPTVTLLSDLGVADESVGVLHSIVADLAPGTPVNDLLHTIPPGDVRSASVALARAVGYLPEGIVVVAVDAGIDAQRPAVAVVVGDGRGVFVALDNGVLAPAVAMAGGADRAYLLDRPEWWLASPGALWPGRDILVPVAAALARGADIAEIGSEIDPDRLLPGVVPLSRHDGDEIVADVIGVDRRGTCQLNLDPDDLDGWPEMFHVHTGQTGRVVRRISSATLTRANRTAPVSVTPLDGDHGASGATPSAFPAGALGAVVDAFGTISLIGAERSAADEFGLTIGDHVRLSRLGPADADRARSGVNTNVTLRRTSQPG